MANKEGAIGTYDKPSRFKKFYMGVLGFDSFEVHSMWDNGFTFGSRYQYFWCPKVVLSKPFLESIKDRIRHTTMYITRDGKTVYDYGKWKINDIVLGYVK